MFHVPAMRSEPASETMHRPKSMGSGEEARVIDEPVGRPGDPCVMVIFGASGDLTKRKLIPALYNLAKDDLLSRQFAVVGSALSVAATRNARDQAAQVDPIGTSHDRPWKRQARLLTLGYIGHTWELFGAWAWIPAFLTASLLSQGRMTGIEVGVWTAVTLHVSGFFGSFLSGYAADRFGARPVLVTFALLGAGCSLVVGWLGDLDVALLLALVWIYGFAIIGDSSVLSSAMTEAVPESQLGRALGLRSILGVGAGSVSPIAFGMALDITPASVSWGLAFCTSAVGGVLAFACAVALRK